MSTKWEHRFCLFRIWLIWPMELYTVLLHGIYLFTVTFTHNCCLFPLNICRIWAKCLVTYLSSSVVIPCVRFLLALQDFHEESIYHLISSFLFVTCAICIKNWQAIFGLILQRSLFFHLCWYLVPFDNINMCLSPWSCLYGYKKKLMQVMAVTGSSL